MKMNFFFRFRLLFITETISSRSVHEHFLFQYLLHDLKFINYTHTHKYYSSLSDYNHSRTRMPIIIIIVVVLIVSLIYKKYLCMRVYM